MSDASFLCPHCEEQADLDVSRGDLHPCPACGRRFWALRPGKRGMVFEQRPPTKGPLWTVWVMTVSLFVLLAELSLAVAVYGGAAWGLWLLLVPS